jgi:hypothetical protein
MKKTFEGLEDCTQMGALVATRCCENRSDYAPKKKTQGGFFSLTLMDLREIPGFLHDFFLTTLDKIQGRLLVATKLLFSLHKR